MRCERMDGRERSVSHCTFNGFGSKLQFGMERPDGVEQRNAPRRLKPFFASVFIIRHYFVHTDRREHARENIFIDFFVRSPLLLHISLSFAAVALEGGRRERHEA